MNTNNLVGVKPKIAVIIPTYNARDSILDVINQIGSEVTRIYVVDDCCSYNSGDIVSSNCKDKRVSVIKHEENQGVGGAVITGYKAAIVEGMDILKGVTEIFTMRGKPSKPVQILSSGKC